MRFQPFFDLSKPHVRAIASPMGGGWVLPVTPEGSEALEEYFGEPASSIPPLGGREGWIVEPGESGELAELLHEKRLAWAVGED